MKRLLFNLAAGISFLVLSGALIDAAAYLLQDLLFLQLPHRWRLTSETDVGLRDYRGFTRQPSVGFHTEVSSPAVIGPEYLTPEEIKWEKQFRNSDRMIIFLGFTYSWFASIGIRSRGNGSPRGEVEFHGHFLNIIIPYWFVILCAVVVPATLAHRAQAPALLRRQRAV